MESKRKIRVTSKMKQNKRNHANCTCCNHCCTNYLSNNQYICSVRRKWINQTSTKSKRIA